MLTKVFSTVALLAMIFGCSPSARTELSRISAKSDPSILTLGPGYNAYVRRIILDDGTEAGIISLADGSSSRFWFRSHHLTRDLGGTLFRFSDGRELYMTGYFCCELQLPEKQPASLEDLRSFIHQHHGNSP